MPEVPKILIIDDDSDLLEVLQESLTTMCQVDHVVALSSLDDVKKNSSDALSCNLAILDVNLGNNQPTGVDIAQWLRQGGFKGHIVFLTGHANSSPEVLSAAKIPDTKVVTKPIGVKQLMGFIENAKSV